jgi:hypothetical protein
MAKGEQGSRRDRTTFFLLAIFLIGAFLWRFFVPAHEYPSSSTRLFTLVLDAGMLIGLIGLRARATSAFDDSTRTMVTVLFWVALVAGIGLFAIRLGGDAQCATGHRIYSLPPH